MVIIDSNFAKQCLPKNKEFENKVLRGKALLFAGSTDYPGAGVLAANAALRAGAGYVILGSKKIQRIGSESPELLLRDLEEKNWKEISANAILIGPGFGVNPFTKEIIESLKRDGFRNVVLDADALTVIAQEKFYPLPSSWIITPHTGELSRLINVPSEEIEKNRTFYLQKAQAQMGCIVLLKGHRSLIAVDSSNLYQNTSGNSALAKSGTGDVLAGITVALLAQGLSPMKAIALATYLHGYCADLWVKERKAPHTFIASDIVETLPRAWFDLSS